MSTDRISPADPALVETWLRARSLCRGLPMPVADHGGWRVETGLAGELRRYVFATPSPELATLAATITTPRVFLKLCAGPAALVPLLPARWRLMPHSTMMTCDGGMKEASAAVPPGYSRRIASDGPSTHVEIVTTDGTLAASGHAAALRDVFVYDRIVTEPAHRRRGLGRAVMASLETARPAGSRQVLVATADGRALYTRLGWQEHAPYTTAVIPDAPD